jgi:Protein of unknown function (DUF2380)
MFDQPIAFRKESSMAGKPDVCRAMTATGIVILLSATLIGAPPAHATEGAPEPIAIAVLDFDYVDTSGEPRDQRQEHAARLQGFSSALRNDLERSGKFRIVAPECGAAPCAADSLQPAELVARARAAGAKLMLFGGIHKQSTLIQWAKVQAVDVDADRLVLDKLVTFRGDTDEAWERAEAFVVREVTALASAR